jgi:outer membrane protein
MCHRIQARWIKRMAFMLGILLSTSLWQPAWGGEIQTLNLQECLNIAKKRNQSQPASRFALQAAEALHRQAMAAYWPQITLRGAYELMDEPRNFLFPGRTFAVPGGSFQTPGGSINIPANAFGPGLPAQNAAIPVGPQNVSIPGMQFHLPDQDIKLYDRSSWYATLEAKWLLWDGGKREGLADQARAGVDAARAAAHRTDMEVSDSVKRHYYGAVVARQMNQLGQDTLARMEATLSLTETLYKEGSGRVKKTDYLDNKVMVETLRSAVALLEKNEAMTRASLAYTMGLTWKDSIIPKDQEVPYQPSNTDLEALVSQAYSFSPDWQTIEAGIRAAEGAVRTAKSGHFPRVFLKGDLHRWWNDANEGYATDENKQGWTITVGIELPIFKGFLTRNRISRARADLNKVKAERVLLREGIGLKVRDIVLGLGAAEKRYQATLEAKETATENRDLNTRAYQNDLVETGDVIRAQIMEAIMAAQHYKMRYDHATLLSKLNLVVGTEVKREMERR